MENIWSDVKFLRLKWLCHVKIMEDKGISKSLIYNRIREDKSKKGGGNRKMWLQDTGENLRIMETKV